MGPPGFPGSCSSNFVRPPWNNLSFAATEFIRMNCFLFFFLLASIFPHQNKITILGIDHLLFCRCTFFHFLLLQRVFLDGDGDVDVVLFCCMCSFHVFCSFVFLQVTVCSMVLLLIWYFVACLLSCLSTILYLSACRLFILFLHFCLTDWLIDWSIDWLVDWLVWFGFVCLFYLVWYLAPIFGFP